MKLFLGNNINIKIFQVHAKHHLIMTFYCRWLRHWKSQVSISCIHLRKHFKIKKDLCYFKKKESAFKHISNRTLHECLLSHMQYGFQVLFSCLRCVIRIRTSWLRAVTRCNLFAGGPLCCLSIVNGSPNVKSGQPRAYAFNCTA